MDLLVGEAGTAVALHDQFPGLNQLSFLVAEKAAQGTRLRFILRCAQLLLFQHFGRLGVVDELVGAAGPEAETLLGVGFDRCVVTFPEQLIVPDLLQGLSRFEACLLEGFDPRFEGLETRGVCVHLINKLEMNPCADFQCLIPEVFHSCGLSCDVRFFPAGVSLYLVFLQTY